ncbi:SAM-dependent methyltransferase [soil metagenome]
MQSLRTALAQGPIPFEQFMQIALYGAEGFFTTGRLRSVQSGDFLTSPEVSPYFGKTLAAFVAGEMARLGRPFSLVEAGAGSGSLLQPLLAAVDVEAWAVEVSPAARESLQRFLHVERIVGSLDAIPKDFRGVFLANELVDNLPMALGQRSEEGWREKWVGSAHDGFEFVDAPVRPEVLTWLEQFAGPVETGGLVEVQLEAARCLGSIMKRMSEGVVVLFDYGELAENLSHRRKEGTVRTYREHHLGPPLFHEPGMSDITADVNFSALLAVVEAAGWEGTLQRQDDFLNEWGLGLALAELRAEEAHWAGKDEMRRLEIRHEIVNAKTLLNERGLGDFRVLIARSPRA